MRKDAKLPLDFTHGIRYNKSRSKTMRRCVGMADEGDSKSLVLITRVGSTPTTGIKNKLQLRLGLIFYAGGGGSKVHDRPQAGTNSPVGCWLVHGSRPIGMSNKVHPSAGSFSGLCRWWAALATRQAKNMETAVLLFFTGNPRPVHSAARPESPAGIAAAAAAALRIVRCDNLPFR